MPQITAQGYPVQEVSGRLCARPHSPYEWVKRSEDLSPNANSNDREAENGWMKRKLDRMTDERDILN